MVGANLNVKSVAELAALSKAKPGTLSYSTAAVPLGVLIERMKKDLGIDMVRVPFRGGGEAVNGMLTGATPVAFFGIGNFRSHLEAGTIRGIAVDAAKRSPLFPDIPTLKEVDPTAEVTRADFSIWVPKGTPKAIIDKLNREIVKVVRSPVTREWTMPQGPGTAGPVARGLVDKAIWIESADSVGFSMGFTCTAFIAEDDAAKFLYWYPSGSLANVMDSEVRGRIQQVAAEVAARYPLDQLRAKKQEIADGVKRDVTNFFALRGVTVTTVGMFGGMTYENPAIQKAIDETFIAQQLKVVAEAKFEAQKKENDRIQLEAEANAEKARREAQGQSEARKLTAAAEAEAIREVSRALGEAQQNPLLLQIRQLEVEKARVERWDGKYPTWFFGAGATPPNLLVHNPLPGSGINSGLK